MQDKFDLLEHKIDMDDPKAVQAIQKRYQNLGKDLKPLEEKIRYLQKLADEVGCMNFCFFFHLGQIHILIFFQYFD